MSLKSPSLESVFASAIQKSVKADMLAYVDMVENVSVETKAQVKQLIEAHCATANSFLESPAEGMDSELGKFAETMDIKSEAMDAGLSQAFDERTAIVVGGTSHSVLKSLNKRVGKSLNVTLKGDSGEHSKAHKPNSTEIPNTDSDSRYQLHGEIARGGMGAVLKGRDVDLGRDLAVKVLLDKHKDNPELLERFVEEAQIGGQLQHPGIVPVYELGEFKDERPFFTMKLVKGETLAAILAKRKSPDEDLPKLVGIFEQICQTMAYAHSKGVIHRDLKPANIMVGAFGEVQVMDWGLSKVLETGGVADEQKSRDRDVSVIQTRRSEGSSTSGLGSETIGGSIMGTPAYMPPEQALGETERLDARSDVFSLGAVLAEILTGKPSYAADDFDDIVSMARRGKVAECHERLDASNAPSELIDICKKALEPEQIDRHGDASELSSNITAYLEGVQEKLKQTEMARARAETRSEEEKKRKRLYMGFAGLVGVALILTGGLAVLLDLERDKARIAENAEKQAREEAEVARDDSKQAEQEAVDALGVAQMEKTQAELVRLVEKSKALRFENKPITAMLLLVEALELAERTNQKPFPEGHEALLEATMEISGKPISAPQTALSVQGNRRIEIEGDWLRVWDLSIATSDPSIELKLEFPSEYSEKSERGRVEISEDARSILFATTGGTYFVQLNETATQVSKHIHLMDANEAFVMSPDGRMLVYSAAGEGILRTDILEESSEIALGKLGKWSMPRFSPDGHWAASHVGNENQGYEVMLWDLQADDIASSMRRAATSQGSVEFSGNSQWMTVGDKCFDLQAEQPLESAFKLYTAGNCSFNRESNMLAVGLLDEIWLYDIDEEGPKPNAILKRRNFGDVCFSPDGRWLASGEDLPCRVRLWDLNQLSNEAKRSIVLPDGNQVKLWEPLQGDFSLIPQRGPSTVLNGGGNNNYTGIEFSTDGRFLKANSYESGCRLWDVQEQRLSETILPIPENPKCICCSPDGNLLSVGCEQGITKLFRLEDGLPVEEVATLKSNHDRVPLSEFSSSGKRLVAWPRPFTLGPVPIEVWDTSNPSEPVTRLTGFDVQMYRVHMSDDERFVVAYAFPWEENDSNLYCWDLHQNETDNPRVLAGHKRPIRVVRFDDEMKVVISASLDGRILKWDLEQAQPMPEEVFVNSEPIHQLARTEDGWGIATMNLGESLGHVWHLDSTFQVLSSNDVDTGFGSQSPKLYEKYLISPDGNFFAGQRSVWDVSRASEQLMTTHGHNGLYANAFSPDSRLYAAISHRTPGSVWLTRNHTGQTMQLDKILGRRSELTTSFSPDSRWLATATYDHVKEIRFWDMDVDRLIERAKRLAGRELTPEERTEFSLDQFAE